MAYQQMINNANANNGNNGVNGNPHIVTSNNGAILNGGNRPGVQTHAFLSPTQLAQLGILGMSPNVQQVTQYLNAG